MSTRESPLAVRAENAIRRLREVEGVSVRAEDEALVEIHVLSSSTRSPKQVARDVQAVLRTELGLSVDHRIVSVALARADEARPTPAEAGPPADDRAAAARPSALGGVAADAGSAGDRIRYENANVIVNGPRTQVQVELRWKGLPRIGNASGWSTRDDAHRLVAQAAAHAVQEFLADPIALNVRDVTLVDAGGRKVAVVVMSLHAHRHEKVLSGSCSVEGDTPQAVVLATLAALNRIVAGLRVKEPTEYVLRAEQPVGGH
jgi:hypothetical protein